MRQLINNWTALKGIKKAPHFFSRCSFAFVKLMTVYSFRNFKFGRSHSAPRKVDMENIVLWKMNGVLTRTVNRWNWWNESACAPGKPWRCVVGVALYTPCVSGCPFFCFCNYGRVFRFINAVCYLVPSVIVCFRFYLFIFGYPLK